MKKIQKLILVLTSIMAFTACRSGSHVIITSDDNNTNTRLEYWGNVVLNGNRSAIKSIPADGYVDYKKNNEDLHITRDRDGIFHYELNGNKISQLDEPSNALLVEAVAKIAKLQNGH